MVDGIRIAMIRCVSVMLHHVTLVLITSVMLHPTRLGFIYSDYHHWYGPKDLERGEKWWHGGGGGLSRA